MLPPQAQATLDNYFAQLRLARASELAQSSRFLEAEVLLSPNGRLPDNPCELDMLARIAAQQEQFGKARKLWEAALLKVPGNEEYTQCLQQAKKWEHLSNALDKVVNFVLWMGLALCIAAIIYLFKPLK